MCACSVPPPVGMTFARSGKSFYNPPWSWVFLGLLSQCVLCASASDYWTEEHKHMGSGTSDLELNWKHWQWAEVKDCVSLRSCFVESQQCLLFQKWHQKSNYAQHLLFAPDYLLWSVTLGCTMVLEEGDACKNSTIYIFK